LTEVTCVKSQKYFHLSDWVADFFNSGRIMLIRGPIPIPGTQRQLLHHRHEESHGIIIINVSSIGSRCWPFWAWCLLNIYETYALFHAIFRLDLAEQSLTAASAEFGFMLYLDFKSSNPSTKPISISLILSNEASPYAKIAISWFSWNTGSVHAPFDEIYAGMGSHVKGITRNNNGSHNRLLSYSIIHRVKVPWQLFLKALVAMGLFKSMAGVAWAIHGSQLSLTSLWISERMLTQQAVTKHSSAWLCLRKCLLPCMVFFFHGFLKSTRLQT